MNTTTKKKIYIIRKFVVATSIEDAIRLERKQKPDDVFLEDTSRQSLFEEILAAKKD